MPNSGGSGCLQWSEVSASLAGFRDVFAWHTGFIPIDGGLRATCPDDVSCRDNGSGRGAFEDGKGRVVFLIFWDQRDAVGVSVKLRWFEVKPDDALFLVKRDRLEVCAGKVGHS